MTGMRRLIREKLTPIYEGENLVERILQMEGDFGGTIRVAENPGPRELKSLIDEGRGLRLLVGADELSDVYLVWAGTGDSGGSGAIHETVGDQYGMELHGNRHVPLEMTPNGKLRVTVTTQETALEDRRDVEDVLDRNRRFQRALGDKPIDFSAMRGRVW